jgi:hypothetical protein
MLHTQTKGVKNYALEKCVLLSKSSAFPLLLLKDFHHKTFCYISKHQRVLQNNTCHAPNLIFENYRAGSKGIWYYESISHDLNILAYSISYSSQFPTILKHKEPATLWWLNDVNNNKKYNHVVIKLHFEALKHSNYEALKYKQQTLEISDNLYLLTFQDRWLHPSTRNGYWTRAEVNSS